MKFFKHLAALTAFVLVLAVLSYGPTKFFAPDVIAQGTSPQGLFYTIHPSKDLGAIKSIIALSGAASSATADQSGFGVARVLCVYNQSAHVSSPSTTVNIQNKDKASGKYYTVITSPGITADNTPTEVAIGNGVATTTNVGAGVPVAATWRAFVSVTGTATNTTGTIGCVVQQ